MQRQYASIVITTTSSEQILLLTIVFRVRMYINCPSKSQVCVPSLLYFLCSPPFLVVNWHSRPRLRGSAEVPAAWGPWGLTVMVWNCLTEEVPSQPLRSTCAIQELTLSSTNFTTEFSRRAATLIELRYDAYRTKNDTKIVIFRGFYSSSMRPELDIVAKMPSSITSAMGLSSVSHSKWPSVD